MKCHLSEELNENGVGKVAIFKFWCHQNNTLGEQFLKVHQLIRSFNDAKKLLKPED